MDTKYKIDLHTHSILSKDGGLSSSDIDEIFKQRKLDFIAITDHNEIEFAKQISKVYPKKIICGEEIKTTEGEIIGLYLEEKIPKGLSFKLTIEKIKEQGGIVYLPHPFDTRRSAPELKLIENHITEIDIFEIFNARTVSSKARKKAYEFGNQIQNVKAVGTDAHSLREIGNTYNLINSEPEKGTLLKLLKEAKYETNVVSVTGMLSPKLNIIKKLLK